MNVINRYPVINIVLALSLISGIAFCSLPLIADIVFNMAQKLESDHNRDKASQGFKLAFQLDPLNAEYHEKAGEAYRERTHFSKDPEPILLKAENEFKKGAALNPHNAYCLIGLATAEKELYLYQKGKYADRLPNAIKHFKSAFLLDPNNYIDNYAILYNLLHIWHDLGAEDRDYTAKLFKKYTDDMVFGDSDRALIRKKIAELKTGPAPTKIPAAWCGILKYDANSGKDGNMYWNGAIGKLVYIPDNAKFLKITARGSKVDGVYPFMLVSLDGEEAGGAYVDNNKWQTYRFQVASKGLKVLTIFFVNDALNKKTGEDRNLYIGEVGIEDK